MKLPISINTEMRSYPFLSNYFGILEANNFDTINIRTNHYIRLNYKYFKGSLTFSEEKYIKSYFEIHNFFKNYDINLLKEHIKNNEYVALMIDGSKLNTNIELINETHTYLIYGIEMSTQTINLAGYIREKDMNKYTSFDISFNDFINLIPKTKDLKRLKNNIMFNHYFKLKSNIQIERINYSYIKKQLARSIFEDSICRFKNHIVFCDFIGRTITGRNLIDKRDFRILYEYLTNLNLICIKNGNLNYLIKQSSYIANLGNITLMLSAKYHLVSDEKKHSTYKKIINLLNEIISLERKLKIQIIEHL